MIYVFEGINGAGKSTAAAEFAKEKGLRIYDDPSRRATGAANRTAEQWRDVGNQAVLDVQEFSKIADFVVDRWCLSSMVYDFLRGVYAGDEFYRPILEQTPAKIYLLDLDPVIALHRVLARDFDRQIDLSYLNLVEQRNRYLLVYDILLEWGVNIELVDSSDAVSLGSEGDRLSDLLTVQAEFNEIFFETQGIDIASMDMEQRVHWTKEFFLHLTEELHEFLRETNWKMHRRHSFRLPVRERLVEEWVDAFKFLLGVANVWEFSALEMIEGFHRKSAEVQKRFHKERVTGGVTSL